MQLPPFPLKAFSTKNGTTFVKLTASSSVLMKPFADFSRTSSCLV